MSKPKIIILEKLSEFKDFILELLTEHTSDDTVHITSEEKTKLSSVANGAEVNQNAFSNVVVGSTTISADSKTDSLTLTGSNVTLTPDTTNDKVTIGITKDNVTSALGYTPPTTNTTYGVATSSALGLVKSGTDITVDSSGNVSVKDNSHKHTVSNISDLTATASELNVLDGITASTAELNYTDGVTSNIQTQLNAKAPLASPTLTGTPKAPTATAGTNSTQIATTAFVTTAVANGIAASDAMIIKGTIGTSGTVTSLPTTYKTGWTYRVVTAGTYAGQVCEIGDLIVALVDRSGSGNVDSDWCVAQTNINGAITGIKSGDAYIATSQSGSVVTITHKDVTRTNTTSTASPSHGGTFTAVKTVTSDAKGHVTGVDTETVTLPTYTALKNPNAISINGKSYDGSSAVNVGTIGAAYGGTGKTSLNDSANVLINSLSTGDATPSDADYYVAQYAGGGTTTTTYHRRPISTLWNYIKSKLATVATSGSYNDLSNKPTIGNGTVTIKQAGTSKGTFTMNQSGNTTIELTDNNTTYGVVSTSADGLAPKRDGSTTKYLRADGTWAVPPDTNTTYTSLKNPYALTIQGNGTTLTNGTYDGSSAKTVNITPSAIGAAASSHTHNYAGSSSAGGAATTALACTGNSSTATKLQTARKINGVEFDGTKDINVVDDTAYQIGRFAVKDTGWYRIMLNANSNTLMYNCLMKIEVATWGAIETIILAVTVCHYGFKVNVLSHYNASGLHLSKIRLVQARTNPYDNPMYIDILYNHTSGANVFVEVYDNVNTRKFKINPNLSATDYTLNILPEALEDGYVSNIIDLPTCSYFSTSKIDELTVGSISGVNYAGSSSAGGAANSADKLNTDAGSVTQPVYFKDGIPVATTYTLGKSVPSNAVFTDTKYSNMTAATSSAAGKAGLVPAPAAGKQASFLRGDGTWVVPTDTTYSNFVKSGSGAKAGLVPAPSTTAGTTKYLREDGTWVVPPNTTYSAMTAATSSAAGKAGLVPAPAAGKQASFLRGDGTWVVPTDTKYTHPSYTARTGKPTANQTPAFGGTATVSQITSDATGHVTGATDRTITIPSTLSNGTGTAGLIKTTSTVTSNSGYTACPVISGVPYYKDTNTTYTSLKNPYSLTIQGNGTTLTNGTYDGSAAKTVNITPSSIGAAPATHTHNYATTSTAGLMSASDKSKLDGIATGANKITIAANLTTTETGYALDATMGKNLREHIVTNAADISTLNSNKLTGAFKQYRYTGSITKDVAVEIATIGAYDKIISISLICCATLEKVYDGGSVYINSSGKLMYVPKSTSTGSEIRVSVITKA